MYEKDVYGRCVLYTHIHTVKNNQIWKMYAGISRRSLVMALALGLALILALAIWAFPFELALISCIIKCITFVCKPNEKEMSATPESVRQLSIDLRKHFSGHHGALEPVLRFESGNGQVSTFCHEMRSFVRRKARVVMNM